MGMCRFWRSFLSLRMNQLPWCYVFQMWCFCFICFTFILCVCVHALVHVCVHASERVFVSTYAHAQYINAAIFMSCIISFWLMFFFVGNTTINKSYLILSHLILSHLISSHQSHLISFYSKRDELDLEGRLDMTQSGANLKVKICSITEKRMNGFWWNF